MLQLKSSDRALGDRLWKRIDAEMARILFGASGPACFQVKLRYETHR